MNGSDAWRMLFENWPSSIPHTGLVITSFQETITFSDFLISGGILLLERDKPDTVGARKVLISYEHIAAVKFTSPMELEKFQQLGFHAPM